MQLCLVPEAMKNWEKRRECENGRAQESGLKVRRTWGKGWRREGSWHQEQIENDLLCFFSFF